ncbi:Cysteine desulfurase [Granulicella sibirica]|uniref:Cysteine desulfurase n=2 Tax=Granulicella sibirica TaxID=2479048 RepID=A0A4Q0SYN1_9BACT|nr:Cysteine desulfurase [Granulicella sibirica]
MAPQFGATPTSPFPAPGADKLPSESSAQRLCGSGPSFYQPEVASAPATPNPAPYAPAGVPQQRPTPSTPSAPSFLSSFSLFEPTLPSLPGFGALPTEDEVKAALNSVSSLYFLEDAGALSKPTSTASAQKPAAATTPTLLPDLHLPRKQFDIDSIRRDFPILQERVNGKPLIWLDNAATTQKPQSVIDRISYFYQHENSNIHRAAHELAARATDAYEGARSKVARFLNAPSTNEVVFVRGATEAINLVAKSWGRRHIGKDDEIVISWIEHHANIVPWQMLAAETGARLRVAPVDNDGQILLDEFEKLLNPKTRLVSITQVSNALGTITPTRQMVQMAHRYGARVLVDGAQSVSHMATDVQALDCDFFVFSGHKVFGPTGIGVLYGKPDALADSPPWQGGGNMIVDVTFEKTIYHAPPARFEAGTGNIADAVGLGAAIDYVESLGMENIARHEHDLLIYATNLLKTIPGLRLIGTAKEKASVMSFVLEGYKTEEVGAALNKEGIAVRSGHHCAQPALRRFGVETSVRPSLALYNNYDDVDALIAVLRKLKSNNA